MKEQTTIVVLYLKYISIKNIILIKVIQQIKSVMKGKKCFIQGKTNWGL